MKKPLVLLSFLFVLSTSFAQVHKIASGDLKVLRSKEDSLKQLAKSIFVDTATAGRMRNDSLFVRTLVRSLQVKNSFYYSYDSVEGISKLYAPDSTFRIFTWQIDFGGYYVRQRGAIQYHTPDGSLKLVPLRDYSEFTDYALDSVRTKDNWIGAVYYGITKTQYKGKNYYTLFGYDQYGGGSNKKWIEVLTFDNRNMPLFGGEFFSFTKDSTQRPDQYRFYIEYKKDASTTVNFDPDLNMILYDHLVSESNESDSPWTMVPDGDYEGFKWEAGKWVHVDKVFDQKLKDGEFPMPDPLRDDKGNNNEEKLKQQSEKNKIKKKNYNALD